MKDFYLKHMHLSHHNKQWEDRRNYAKAAGVDFVREFYLKESEYEYYS